MHRNYQLNVLRELRDQQVRYAPRDKKIEQCRRAETLYREIDGSLKYSYRFVCVGITEFRAEMHPELMLEGDKLRHDLLLFIEDLFDAADVDVREMDEKVWTIDELSKRFNVSGKTISRWRKHGLVSRKFFFGNKKRVGFLAGSVDFFLDNDPDRVKRGERFSQLTQEEKRMIIQTARRFADSSVSPTEVAKRIARYTGRSVETIRYTLKAFDEQNIDIPLFPHRHTPLSEETKQKIFLEYRHGISIETLAKVYDRTRGSIYRIAGQMRARCIAEFNLDYIDNPVFHDITPEKERAILGPMPSSHSSADSSDERRKFRSANASHLARNDPETTPHFIEIVRPEPLPGKAASDAPMLPPYLSGLYKIPLLTVEQELHLFRKMNYLKFKASAARDRHDPDRPKNHLMSQIEKLCEQAVATKNEIVSANLRLVVSIAKRHVGPYANFFDLVSDGNLSLLRATDKFDYARGNRFSTYATWAITRNFARTIPDEKKHRDRFHLREDDVFEEAVDGRSDLQLQEMNQIEREQQVNRLLHELNDREQKIIMKRFGIGSSNSPLTLNEVGVEIGVTKERVRQIEARALEKLRKVAEAEDLDIPGL